MEDSTKSGIYIKHILLLEAHFKRIEGIDFSQKEIPSVDVKTNYFIKDSEVICNVELKFTVYNDGGKEPIIEAFVKMNGVFTKIGTPTVDMDAFGKINAPSIIFPFIREHLGSLSVKAGLNPILIAPVNFVALAADAEKKLLGTK